MKWYERLFLAILSAFLLFLVLSIYRRQNFYERAFKEQIEQLKQKQDSLKRLSSEYEGKIRKLEVKYYRNAHKRYHIPKSHDSLKSILTDSARYYLFIYAGSTDVGKDSIGIQNIKRE